MSKRYGALLAAMLLGVAAGSATAQSFPAKPMSGEDYAKWAAETYKCERATIERVGLLAK